jgi:hypothetical protein
MRRLLPVALASAAFLVLALNTAANRKSFDLTAFPFARRYWEDLTVAIRLYVDEKDPAGRIQGPKSEHLKDSAVLCRSLVRRLVKREGIEPWQFWRTIWTSPFELSREDFAEARPEEDPGRAELLALGFRALGGIAPFLLLWLAVLPVLPVFLWIAWEFDRGGRALAGALFLLALALSPFVVQCLSLPHSGLGFYLLAWLVLVAFSASIVLRQPTPRGLLVRALLCGLILAGATLCRGGTLLLAPGFTLALALGARQLPRPGRALLAGGLLLLLPLLLFRPHAHHNVWPSIWEGLGDFDREKGYAWSDRLAKVALLHSGIDPGPEELASIAIGCPECEAYFKGAVLRDIRQSPLWYLRILAKRVLATVFQTKLWPYGPRDGISVAPGETENEGNMDKYYRMTTTVDFLGFGDARREIRVGLLLLPTALLAGLAFFRRSSAVPALSLLAPPALAALASPVLISTASAVETEIFALTYLLGAALVVEEALRALRPRAA